MLSLIVLLGCKPTSNTEAFWKSISTSNSFKPFTFIITSSKIPTCADHGQPKMEALLNGNVEGVEEDKVTSVMMHASLSDPYYSYIAEEIKFLFDQNGNETLETWPAYFNNLTCYNIDSMGWHSSIKSDLEKSPSVKLGVKTEVDGGKLRVYVRGEYNETVSEQNLAVYLYYKTEEGEQSTSSGTESYTIKNRVYSALTPSLGIDIGTKKSGDEIRESYTHTGTFSKDNLGVLVVVYKTENDIPVAVENSVAIEKI